MKLKIAALAAALTAAALGGCQTLTALSSAGRVELRATQALYVAEAAFAGASLTLEGAVDGGTLKGADAAEARSTFDEAHAALLAARAAKAAGDYGTELARASDATAAAGRLQGAGMGGDE